MTAAEVKTILGLRPHPREGGWYARTYEAPEWVEVSGFDDGRYGSARRTGTAIYYLLEPDSFSELHRLQSDEVFHFYGGDAVEMLQLFPGGRGRQIVIGPDLKAGQRPQIVVERGVWQGSRLVPGGQWALLGCTVSPGFEFEDYEAGDRIAMTAQWPEFTETIARLTQVA